MQSSNEIAFTREELERSRNESHSLQGDVGHLSRGILRIHVLASGSKGNATIIEDTRTGEGVLIDAGICKRDVLTRSLEAGFNLCNLRAVLVTHEHSDHVKGLGVLYRELSKRGLEVPLIVHESCLKNSRAIQEACELTETRFFQEGSQFSLAGMQIWPFATSHDAACSFGFRFWDGHDALGFMTDTGIVTDMAHDALGGCRILAIEANHDPRMLANGPYPYHLQQRVASELGHLSNGQSAEELLRLLHPGLEQVIAMHISENNNTYRLPVEELRRVIGQEGHNACVVCAYQKRLVSY